jgi:MFS family permease
LYPIFSRVAAGGELRSGALSTVPRNVVFLGITSFLTDVSSEIITSILPLYLVAHLGLSPAGFGAIDSLHQGGASLLRLWSGWVSDRSQRFKRIAAIGYGLSAACRLALLTLGGNAMSFALITFMDRLGKGIRTSPRDALISLSVAPSELGRAFGVHRTLDTAGAVLGPVLAFAVLRFSGGAYDAVFVVSFAFGLMGVAVLLAFVRDPGVKTGDRAVGVAPTAPVSWAMLAGLLRERGMRNLWISAGALGCVTISDGLFFLLLQRRLGFDAEYVPLLYVAVPCAWLLLALPFGRMADRWGRAKLLLLGHACLILLYLLGLVPMSGLPMLVLSVVLLGAFYAASDGVLMALAGAHLPPHLMASGLAVVVTANNLGRVLASVIFGVLWSQCEEGTALLVFGIALGVVLVTVGVVLLGLDESVRQPRP